MLLFEVNIMPMIAVVLMILSSVVCAIDYAPVVTIDSGKLRGIFVQVNNTNAIVRKYLGIPFAKAERFEPPTQPPKWPDSEVKDMTTLGKACPQVLGPFGVSKIEGLSEDCLNLNVFVPHENSAKNLPVMVWIHGGGFLAGSNRDFDASYISVLGKVVAVVINYRLSVFGFLTNGRNGDIKGNYGMLDQIEALKWVKKNIHSFNGDPNKVTIFGQSAGGASVSLLMLSKLAKGLFHRAISQSGDAASPWATSTYDVMLKKVKIFSRNVGCTQDLAKLKNCLESKNMMEIVNASAIGHSFPAFNCLIDGYFLPDTPNVLYDKLLIDNIDMMIGVTDDEGIVVTNAIPGVSFGISVTNGLTRDYFIKEITRNYNSMPLPQDPVLIDATIYRYTDWTNVTNPFRNRRMFVDAMSDITIISSTVKAAVAYSMKGARAYFYHLEYRDDVSAFGFRVPSWVRAYHSSDIQFLFGSILRNEKATVSANFSRKIIKLWTNFAKTGNPNSPERTGISWPQYTLNEQKYLSLKPDMAVNSYLRADYVAYWNKFIPDAFRSTPTSQPYDLQEVKSHDLLKKVAHYHSVGSQGVE